jgi:hypothetical protein
LCYGTKGALLHQWHDVIGEIKMMKIKTGLAIALLGLMVGICCFFSYQVGAKSKQAVGVDGRDYPALNDGTQLNVLCDSIASIPSAGLDSKRVENKFIVVGGFNLNDHTGWYQGHFAIDETRKGTLVVSGTELTVTRPALFRQFGERVIKEGFTVDRNNGDFRQWLAFENGQKVEFIKGHCGKVTRPPF